MVLQGYGVTIDLVGTTFISKSGITSTTFKTVPDQPFTSFELDVPRGQVLGPGRQRQSVRADRHQDRLQKSQSQGQRGMRRPHLRKVKETVATSLQIPNEFIAQNGAEIHQTTPIAVEGCPKAVPAKKVIKKKKKGKVGKKGNK